MKIYSELTHKEYQTVEDCLQAEQEYNVALAAQQEEAKKLSQTKKADADAVANAYKKMMDDEKEYLKLRNEFVKKYGCFHMTYRDSDAIPVSNILDMFRFF